MTAEEINAKIFKAKADKIKVYPVRNLRASNLGFPCERYLFLLIRHWDEQKPHDVGLQNIFDLGNTLEEHTIRNIKEAGFEVMDKITIYFNAENKVSDIFAKYGEEIKGDVLGLDIVSDCVDGYQKEWNINGETVLLGVKKN